MFLELRGAGSDNYCTGNGVYVALYTAYEEKKADAFPLLWTWLFKCRKKYYLLMWHRNYAISSVQYFQRNI